MLNQRLTSVLALLLAGVVLAGCSSSNREEAPPAEPAPAPEDTTPVEVPQEPEPRGDFDPSTGDPIDPRTGGLLDRTFYFGYDRSTLNPQDLATLQVHAEILKRNRDKTVVIAGHCDERGTREYNLALGERRGNSVSGFLTSSGVSPRQIETVSYGEERPEDPGHDDAAWARNRRAVLTYR